MATLKEAIVTLLKAGGKRVDNILVQNINVTPTEKYVRVSLTLDKNVEGYVQDEHGEFAKGETNLIYISLYSIAAMLKETEEMSWAANEIVANPRSLQVLLSHARISIIQEPITAGQPHVNAFNGKTDEQTPDHDTIYNHIVDVHLGKIGEIALEKMMNKMLGC